MNHPRFSSNSENTSNNENVFVKQSLANKFLKGFPTAKKNRQKNEDVKN